MDIVTALIQGDLARRVWELQRENERLRDELAKISPESRAMLDGVSHVSYSDAVNVTDEQRAAIPYELMRRGDCVLVWANEGELCVRGKRVA